MKQLRELRERAGLTQADLARLATTSVNALQRYEYGKNIPPADTLRRIADALAPRLGVSTASVLKALTNEYRDGGDA